ncbi:hypothetical protein MTQ93_09585 [Staphylococcus agnetis]|uniref:hypothetical protein n=1 Tax=Staphylococcus agnetis TaxID=985762 RepID=UPI00208E501A|nr:hypothetical protein [Staphylococcus agnetis]MCO4346295.1 hypothetical protein [Staphylococcus agnetis]MCO4360629.1 hypothetical protein [Staphylococcus agnetis]
MEYLVMGSALSDLIKDWESWVKPVLGAVLSFLAFVLASGSMIKTMTALKKHDYKEAGKAAASALLIFLVAFAFWFGAASLVDKIKPDEALLPTR